MKIILTLGELSNKVNDWNFACEILHLDPWCMNEGTAQSSDEIKLTLGQMHELGLQWMLSERC